MNKKIIMATGQYEIDNLNDTLDGYDVIKIIEYKEDLLDAIDLYRDEVDILMVGGLLGGKAPLFPILNKIRFEYPQIRIVYLTAEVNLTDQVLMNSLGLLASLGVYDILEDSVLTPGKIQYLLDNPRDEKNVAKFTSIIKDSSFGVAGDKINIVMPEDDKLINKLRSNLNTFISTKGGTGKSTLLVNTAIAISKMGINTEDEFKPKVLIMDLDFYQFTAGRMLGATNNDKNILIALDAIRNNIESNGDFVNDNNILQETIGIIEKSIVKVKGHNNLHILTGPERGFKPSDVEYLSPNEIYFLANTVSDMYDIILVDISNDPLFEKTLPILELSQSIYYILDMDFKTFLQEGSFSDYYSSLEQQFKTKQVLNKFIDDDRLKFNKDLMKNVGYNINFTVDYFNQIEMLNNSFDNNFIILDKDKKSENFRYGILNLANDMWGINNFDKISEALNKNDNSEKIVKIKTEDNEDNEKNEEKEDFLTKIGKKLLNK